MKVIYVGQCEFGSTSRMRFDKLSKLLNVEIELIDLSPKILSCPKIFRSLGWRFKIGPMIYNINILVRSYINTSKKSYDLIWVDKGVFLSPKTIELLRSRTRKFIHFTPDPAFLYHKSRFFSKTVGLYDNCITTKSYEVDFYLKSGCKDIILCTQGYDDTIHKPYCDFHDKIYDICFIGHNELNRQQIIQKLLDSGFTVVLAGINWGRFVKNNQSKSNLHYMGSSVIGADYSKLISQSRLALGLLSKWIPEKHTTRTFEIPACGTALLTESNDEILSVFDIEDIVVYNSEDQILSVVRNVLNDLVLLESITISGYNKVINGDFTYEKILNILINKIL